MRNPAPTARSLPARIILLFLSALFIPAPSAASAPPAETPAPINLRPETPIPLRRDVIIEFNADDGTPLEAKLSVPTISRVGENAAGAPAVASGGVPVVFYLHGAGLKTYDNPFGYRDDTGEVKVGRYLDFYADELARRGIAFFRMSKRGCQALSEPPYMKVDREVFAKATHPVLLADYEQALQNLRKQPEIDEDRIVLIGASEGTRLAPQLALRSPAGIAGIIMAGYAADNAKNTVIWQNSIGPWRNIQHLFPAARDGALTKEEYDAFTAEPANAPIAQAVPFTVLDADADGSLTAQDLEQMNRPRLDAILKAVDEGDDELLWRAVLNLSSEYLRSWWVSEPNSAFLLKLDIPLAIFHGGLDGACRVEGVHETEKTLEEAGKDNLTTHIYPMSNHDLDWTWQSAQNGGAQPFRDMFTLVEQLTAAQPNP